MTSKRTTVAEPRASRLDPRIAALLPALFDLAVPTLVFYGLRSAGVGLWWALVLGGLASYGSSGGSYGTASSTASRCSRSA